jgi:hypothetical protein
MKEIFYLTSKKLKHIFSYIFNHLFENFKFIPILKKIGNFFLKKNGLNLTTLCMILYLSI